MSDRLDDTLDAAAAGAWMQRFFEAFDREREALAELDRRSGDGDFGTNLRSALGRARKGLDELREPETPGQVFDAVSTAFLHTGGTSGPLFGMWFRHLAKATGAPQADREAVAAGVADATATVMRLGGAKVGDKTMVDALVPASDALTAATGPLGEALAAAARAAREGADSTTAMVANRGRASYVGEVARGVLDPGAATVALLFESATG